jgi:hypothetical protein
VKNAYCRILKQLITSKRNPITLLFKIFGHFNLSHSCSTNNLYFLHQRIISLFFSGTILIPMMKLLILINKSFKKLYGDLDIYIQSNQEWNHEKVLNCMDLPLPLAVEDSYRISNMIVCL